MKSLKKRLSFNAQMFSTWMGTLTAIVSFFIAKYGFSGSHAAKSIIKLGHWVLPSLVLVFLLATISVFFCNNKNSLRAMSYVVALGWLFISMYAFAIGAVLGAMCSLVIATGIISKYWLGLV